MIKFENTEVLEFQFETKKEAEEFVSAAQKILTDYHMLSLADLYDMIGVESRYRDTLDVWSDVSNVKIRKDTDGYSVIFPVPEKTTETGLKKLTCDICGCRFLPTAERHYIARADGVTGGLGLTVRDEEPLYDAFDCPQCGTQMITQPRKRMYSLPMEDVEEDD